MKVMGTVFLQAFEDAHCCQTCMKLFSSESTLRAHQEVCGQSRLYRCKLCWEDTDEPTAHLQDHWRGDPPPELRFNPCLNIDNELPLIKTLYMTAVEPNEVWHCSLCVVSKANVMRQDGWPAHTCFKNRTRRLVFSLWLSFIMLKIFSGNSSRSFSGSQSKYFSSLKNAVSIGMSSFNNNSISSSVSWGPET